MKKFISTSLAFLCIMTSSASFPNQLSAVESKSNVKFYLKSASNIVSDILCTILPAFIANAIFKSSTESPISIIPKEKEEERKRKEEEAERKRKEKEERKKQKEEEENRSSTATDQTSITEQIKLHTDPQISIISKKSKSCWDIHQKIESTNPKAFTKISRIKQELRELQEQIKDNDLETEVNNLEAKIKDLDNNQTKLNTEIKDLDNNQTKLYTKESELGHYKYELGSAQNWLDHYKYELDSKQNWSECYQNELGTEIKELETKIEELNTKIKELETRIEELNNEIDNINTTMNSSIDYIDSLINNRESLINSARTLYTTALSKAKTVAPEYFAKASYANSLRDKNAILYGRKVYAKDIGIVELVETDFIENPNLRTSSYFEKGAESKIKYIKLDPKKYIQLVQKKFNQKKLDPKEFAVNEFFETIYKYNGEFYRVFGYCILPSQLIYFFKDTSFYKYFNKICSCFKEYSKDHAVLLLIPCGIDSHTK